MIYPNVCARCAFCCVSESCLRARQHYGVGKYDPCPGLSFEGNVGHCELIDKRLFSEQAMGMNTGCCIKARAIAKGVAYDFASLPPATKIALAQMARERTALA